MLPVKSANRLTKMFFGGEDTKPKRKAKDVAVEGIAVGTPLPDKGACKHFRRCVSFMDMCVLKYVCMCVLQEAAAWYEYFRRCVFLYGYV